MKKIECALILCLVSITCFSQEINITSNDYPKYQGVISLEGKSSYDIYKNIKLWIADNFKSANDVIQMDDNESGIIVVKGIIPISLKTMVGAYTYSMYTSFKFEIKDGKFRYTAEVASIVDPKAPTSGDLVTSINNKPDGKYQVAAKNNITTTINNCIESLVASLKKADTIEDW